MPLSEQMKTVRKLLNAMSAEERAQVAAFLQAFTAPNTTTKDVVVEDWYNDLRLALQGVSDTPVMPTWPEFVRRTKSMSTFVDAVRSADDNCRQWIRENVTKVRLVRLRKLCCRIIAAEINADPLNPIPMFNQLIIKLEDLPRAFDAAFPGYIRAGLIEKLIKETGAK